MKLRGLLKEVAIVRAANCLELLALPILCGNCTSVMKQSLARSALLTDNLHVEFVKLTLPN